MIKSPGEGLTGTRVGFFRKMKKLFGLKRVVICLFSVSSFIPLIFIWVSCPGLLGRLGSGSPIDGCQFSGLEGDLGDAALAFNVEFVLAAGDLYHQEARSVKAARCLQEGVSSLQEAGIDVYAVYGNHDPLGDRHELLDMPDNFHACPADELGYFEIERGRTTAARVLGMSIQVPEGGAGRCTPC